MPSMKRNNKLDKNFVDVYDWDCPGGFSKWIEDNDILVSAVQDGSDGWVFVNEEDLLAFKLKFKMKRRRVPEIDTGYYYAPYIPLLTCPSLPSDSTT